jgi:TRAP-type C4-dicarboxylate transport system substrate-binding protein
MRARIRWLAAITLIPMILSACSNVPGSAAPPAPTDAGIKVGGKPGPVSITIADSQPVGRPSNLPLGEFKAQVEKLSGGSMTVTILAEASLDADPPDSDGPIIDRVKSGTYQMAVVPARAWSAVGVTSLKALQTPFLIESQEHVNAVVNDAAISKDLMSGLESSGVTGLTLFPESLRHFFSFSEPILTPADVKGRQVRAISSLDTTALIEALGGTAVDPVGDAFGAGVDDGTITAADSSFSIAKGSTPKVATATGNLVLYPKVITLVVNTAFWTDLTDAQRDILSQASAATRAWAIANVTADADAAASYCKDGGTVVLTDQTSIEAFRAAEAPVYAALEADSATKQAIAAIRKLDTGTSPAAVKACKPASQALVPNGGTLPNGVYRVEFTDEYLRSWGVNAADNHGVYTFTLNDGHWSAVQVADNKKDDSAGIYRAEGNDVS